MRPLVPIGLLALALTPRAFAQEPLAPKLTCRSAVLTVCRDHDCSDVFDDTPAAVTTLLVDLTSRTFTMSGLGPEPRPLTRFEIEPGAPNGKYYEAKFQIDLAHGSSNVDLVEVENGPLQARVTTTSAYPDGTIAITGYRCERAS